ncbi:MAG: efflux RND transporter permease subunit, partial [Elusimicrobia bacterium]|nr:efflux RND transporter permease subunit [Elusimicrobiota bacterium]
ILVGYVMPLADKINDALGGAPVDIGVKLYGPDLGVLHDYAGRLVKRLQKIPGLVDVRPPTAMPVPSLQITVDKKAAGRLGISQSAIHDALSAYSMGLVATAVRKVQKSIPVVIRFTKPGQDIDLEALKGLPLHTAGGSTVPLEQVARVGYSQVPSEIDHEHMTRMLMVTADVHGRRIQDAASEIGKAVEALKLPSGVSWGYAGKYEAQRKALSNLAGVFLLAVGVVAVILWFEFRSALQAALVLITVPLAGVGAAWGLWLCGQTLNVSSMIGAVLLVGIVVRNGIMLLDYMNKGLAEGQPLDQAVRSAALKRIRPILMTASVMILGLLPLATGWGTGSELLRPLAVAVIGGILTSTALTLVVLPAAALLTRARGRS